MVGKVTKNFFKDLEESMNDKCNCLVDVTTEIYGFSVTIIQSEYVRSATDKIEKPRFEIDSRTFYNNVDLHEYKQGLAVVDKCVLRLGTSIKGDQRLEITLSKAEKILMLLVIGHASKSNVDIAYHSSAETGLNYYSICYSSGGYSEELYLPQPDERTLMRIYFQCDLAGLSAILSFFNKCHDEYSENQGLDPVLIDRELAHCFGVFLHRQKHANKLNKTRSFSSRFLGLPISQLVIEKVARKSWPMFVDIFKEDRARNYLTLYDRSFATGVPKTSWDSYESFVEDYRSLHLLAPGDMAAAWLSDYTISLWCFMMSMSASPTVHIFYPMFYQYLSSDNEEYRKSINFDFTITPKRRFESVFRGSMDNIRLSN
eukprot:jgi/Psemu1/29675/gm1.29675_g